MFLQSLAFVPAKTWLLLMAGPVLFLVFIAILSVIFSLRSVAPPDIPEHIQALAPYILLAVLLCLGLIVSLNYSDVQLIWQLPDTRTFLTDTAIGLAAGALMALAYLYWLAPLLELAQREFGDYVPPGSVLPVLSTSIGIFFVANVLLAPLIEETLYRGIAIQYLSLHIETHWVILLTCLFFGVLHWAGGFWYMLLTGVVGGGVFVGLFYWRGGIIAPFAAHFTLNLIEFIYAWRAQTQT